MSTGVFDDLQTALGETDPSTVAGLSAGSATRPYIFATDWEISSVDSLTQNTSGPYCGGSSITVEMNFTGEGQSFSRIKSREASYTVNTSQNCSLAGKTPPTFTFTVASNPGDTTGNIIGITFNNSFSTGTGVGTEQQTTFATTAYSVSCDGTQYDSGNDNVIVDYTITCGQTDYYVDLYRDNDGSPTLAAEQNHSSTGSYSITDTSPNSGDASDEYRVDVTDADDGGTTVSCTITQTFPA